MVFTCSETYIRFTVIYDCEQTLLRNVKGRPDYLIRDFKTYWLLCMHALSSGFDSTLRVLAFRLSAARNIYLTTGLEKLFEKGN